MLHMEQISYKSEIINELLSNENHVRGLAKKLNINHMTIARNMGDIVKATVVDYKTEGKNKLNLFKYSKSGQGGDATV